MSATVDSKIATAGVAEHVVSSIDIVIAALSDETRRSALRLVRDAELSAGELAAAFPSISRPAVSQHLRVLLDAGLVTVRREGKRRIYRARTESLAPVSGFVDEMWSNRLQDPRRVADSSAKDVR